VILTKKQILFKNKFLSKNYLNINFYELLA
jgi:hypothetical protein